MGLSRANKKLGAEAIDPKRFADEALLLVKPRFGSVKMFDDLAAARDGGARYFLILDFDQSLPVGLFSPSGVHGWAGALLLDGSFRRIIEIAIDKKTKWFTAPLLSISADAEMIASAKSHDENFKALLPAFSEAFNAALTARGSPMPAAAPSSVVAASTPAPAPTPAPVDQAFLAELGAIPTAGALFALADELDERGERAKAAAAFRAILARFPNDVLAAKAADRLSTMVR